MALRRPKLFEKQAGKPPLKDVLHLRPARVKLLRVVELIEDTVHVGLGDHHLFSRHLSCFNIPFQNISFEIFERARGYSALIFSDFLLVPILKS